MPFLYTLLGIILFIIVLFLIPVRVTAHYEGTFEMYVQYLFLKIRLIFGNDINSGHLIKEISRRIRIITNKY